MRIREDLIGCVIAQGHRLFAGEDVPDGVVVADELLAGERDTEHEDPVEDHSTEIVIDEDAEIGGNEDPDKPARADNKQKWFDYATDVGAIEDAATIEEYSKADLIELVG